jgi:quinol monooxygenase YgiN
MDAKQLLILGASALASSMGGSVVAGTMQDSYVRVAEIQIDPARIEAYKRALADEIEASVRIEPGVLALYAVAEKDDPSRIRVFEIYANEAAYKAHLETPHFRTYKAATGDMVKHLDLIETVPIMLRAKTQ